MANLTNEESLREMIELYKYVSEFTDIINEELAELNKHVFDILTKRMNERFNISCKSQKLED